LCVPSDGATRCHDLPFIASTMLFIPTDDIRPIAAQYLYLYLYLPIFLRPQHVRHSEGSYRDEIIAKVLYMCSKEKFGLVTDFAWYASVLLDLAVMQGEDSPCYPLLRHRIDYVSRG
jgi:hypothetical protein